MFATLHVCDWQGPEEFPQDLIDEVKATMGAHQQNGVAAAAAAAAAAGGITHVLTVTDDRSSPRAAVELTARAAATPATAAQGTESPPDSDITGGSAASGVSTHASAIASENYLHIRWQDLPSQDILAELPRAIAFIHAARISGGVGNAFSEPDFSISY
jgi:hypothetical protein